MPNDSRDRRDAVRWRAFRRIAELALGDDGELQLCAVIIPDVLDGDGWLGATLPEAKVPFLTQSERDMLAGLPVRGVTFDEFRRRDAIDAAVDFRFRGTSAYDGFPTGEAS